MGIVGAVGGGGARRRVGLTARGRGPVRYLEGGVVVTFGSADLAESNRGFHQGQAGRLAAAAMAAAGAEPGLRPVACHSPYRSIRRCVVAGYSSRVHATSCRHGAVYDVGPTGATQVTIPKVAPCAENPPAATPPPGQKTPRTRAAGKEASPASQAGWCCLLSWRGQTETDSQTRAWVRGRWWWLWWWSWKLVDASLPNIQSGCCMQNTDCRWATAAGWPSLACRTASEMGWMDGRRVGTGPARPLGRTGDAGGPAGQSRASPPSPPRCAAASVPGGIGGR